jgi:DNA-binding response OmpR family regulator
VAGRARARATVGAVTNLLIATDADWVYDEVAAALGGRGTTINRVRRGADVVPAVRAQLPDLALLDLQIGNMGAMAVTMALRLEESAGRLDHVSVLMLLDREADVFLAIRSGAEGWLVKPLDAFRLRRAAQAVLDGGAWTEGVPGEPEGAEAMDQVDPAAVEHPEAHVYTEAIAAEQPAGEPSPTAG